MYSYFNISSFANKSCFFSSCQGNPGGNNLTLSLNTSFYLEQMKSSVFELLAIA